MSRGAIAADRPDRIRRAASPAHQEHKGNGSLDGDRAPRHENIRDGSGLGATGGPWPGLIVPDIEDGAEQSGDDFCARSPTTELSDSLCAAYMPRRDDDDGLASITRSAPEPLSVADVPGSLGKGKLPIVSSDDDNDIVSASKSNLTGKREQWPSKSSYWPGSL
ncbi:hypothetical protein P152DRAFT_270721 [Eremomyces bilateralis CBS 781.70]|uniref:Uncharacterized protein n=1 Tax=Eremomyces bilateralis CBS 781.70 TaxID=1392243 RepID=A0A6G1G939_9PEZI|nr:uncharacterized protein P152DRAFT_270721 [Eremomyces bilateralis CBS 781.70]KAF1814421.1 hypothetical protein P152DRAFT_270721 [Eremomyces bilateralis CBS 781.70]